jgi:hypothetical protein
MDPRRLNVQPTPYTPTNGNKTAELVQQTLFAQESVKQLKEQDFALDSREQIRLTYNDCILILFYVENTESRDLAKIWSTAASQVAGPIFAACNLMSEKRVAAAFNNISGDSNHPLNWAGLRQLPFILVYRQGWPQAFYNGERVVGSIIDYSLTLACVPKYTEKVQKFGSMEAENNLFMTGRNHFEERTDSTQFTDINPVDRFNPTYPVATVGSAEAVAEAQRLARSEGVPGTVTAPTAYPAVNGRSPMGVPLS